MIKPSYHRLLTSLHEQEDVGKIKEAIAWPDMDFLSDYNYSWCNICIRYRQKSWVYQSLSDVMSLLKWAQGYDMSGHMGLHQEYGNRQAGEDIVTWKSKEFYKWCKKTKWGIKGSLNHYYLGPSRTCFLSGALAIGNEEQNARVKEVKKTKEKEEEEGLKFLLRRVPDTNNIRLDEHGYDDDDI
jgi:hypothetical protein